MNRSLSTRAFFPFKLYCMIPLWYFHPLLRIHLLIRQQQNRPWNKINLILMFWVFSLYHTLSSKDLFQSFQNNCDLIFCDIISALFSSFWMISLFSISVPFLFFFFPIFSFEIGLNLCLIFNLNSTVTHSLSMEFLSWKEST